MPFIIKLKKQSLLVQYLTYILEFKMRTKEQFLLLLAELNSDVVELKRLLPQNKKAYERIAQGAADEIDYGALGYTITRLYGLVENYFLRISKFFENNVPKESWHKTLLDRMALNIEGLRPAFFETKSEKSDCEELLKFRHRFRNLYGEDLDPVRMKEIQIIAERFFSNFFKVHENFVAKLSSIMNAIE